MRYYEYPTLPKKRNALIKYQQLSCEEGCTIIVFLKSHYSLSHIGQMMDRNKSTISRELSRNQKLTNCYDASIADDYVKARCERSRRGSQFSEQQWRIVLHLPTNNTILNKYPIH